MGDTEGPEVEFEHLVPGWMFVCRSVPSRLAAATLIPLAFCLPLLLVTDVEQLRLGPFLVLAVVAVAAVAGWWATALAGAIVTATYWWSAVPVVRSFRFDHARSSVAVLAMAALVVGISAMARRVERAVVDVRALVEQRRDQALDEVARRQGAERTGSQVQAALELSNALADAATMADVAQVAVDEVRLPAWPTTASVAIVRDHRLHVLAARGATYASIQALERIDLTTSSWLGDALAGTPTFVDDREAFAAAHPEARVLRIYPTGSWAVVPFRSESTVGLLSLYYLGPQRLSEHEAYFSLVAEILSTALERAHAEELQQEHLERLQQAFAERDRIAKTLSTTLLPPSLPELPGFTASGWVLPAWADEVSGDFYDLFSVVDGDWVAVLGDVCGKGAEAAAVTSLARYAARVTALDRPDPARIAEVANAALVEDPSDLFCTMGIVRYRRARERVEVALAGHPQLRLVAGGRVTRIGRFGAALGYAKAPPTLEEVPLEPGGSVVLHSDGLVERDPAFGEDELDELLASAPPGPASAIAEHVRRHLLAVPATRHDDLTLLVITRDA